LLVANTCFVKVEPKLNMDKLTVTDPVKSEEYCNVLFILLKSPSYISRRVAMINAQDC